ncbi:substrate-binding domain-containing protein [Chelativorans sp. AA-79]|uniref:LacI family DNA-binding transcriptional regulator n=1 Tax=Chelativorans sp. AA-79 TaxID=3028735 RepID=UPI0023F6BB2B|nr:substrate-binding domain-containing protein [Chelativorans sp. AA-79]WEX10145.1 substrate-binding domain-containing protein [Chelativorans sp. AA-79]
MARETINLRRLAEVLGVSQTTVSRALNGFPEVNEATRARVVEAARRLNYRPSASAASLATGKARTIGHVVTLGEHMMMNPHFTDFLAGAGEVYSRYGYEFLLRVAAPGDEADVYRDLVSRGRVDGIVVHGPLTVDPRIPFLKSLGVPFVVHGRCGEDPESYSWLDVDNRRAFMRATEFLTDLGHRRIALVNGIEAMNFADRRRQGYESALAARGIALDPSIMFSADMVEPYGYHAAKEMFSGSGPPTAVLVSSILPAMGIMRALAEMGLRPAADLSIIVFDDCLSFLQPANETRPQGISYFTAMRSSIRQAARRVAELLLEQIQAPGGKPKHELWEAELVIGQTTGPHAPAGDLPLPARGGEAQGRFRTRSA